MKRRKRVGLVLGAGGVMGGAWITGGLQALATTTGWDPASADYVVGTSAGSMMGALLASGIPPWFMVAHSAGETFDDLLGPDGRPASSADRSAGARFTWHPHLPRLVLGSPQLVARALTSPRGLSPMALVMGWGPRGMISTEPLKDVIRRVVPQGWSTHPNLWIVATDYGTSERVVFGREDAPEADLFDAVAASCAIPSFYHPVTIGGRLYVDGGVNSVSNLDLLADQELDLVICLNPMSSRDQAAGRNPVDRVTAALRSRPGRMLGREARQVRAAGTEVLLVQPTAEDLAAMGNNWMSSKRRHHVIRTAIRTVAAQLTRPQAAAALDGLPPGAPHRITRPRDIPPAGWADLLRREDERASA